MKPIMMMRTSGLAGPAYAKHAGIKGLSKSTGNAHIPGHKSTRFVPEVIGLTEAAAIAAIEAEDLVASRFGTPVLGLVTIQVPAAKTSVREGTKVNYRLTS